MEFTPSNHSRRKAPARDWWREDGDPDLNSCLHRPSEFIAEIIRRVGLDEGIHEEMLRSMWVELVGDYIAKGSFPDSLKKGMLTIRVTQSAMRFHLEQMKTGLLQKLRASPGGEKIQALRFSFG
jgi:predicted nucleic acid-binding Zn ribbon protein